VSVDGPAEVHDVLRARPGSHAAALRALDAARAEGMTTTSNMQVNQLNRHLLRETCAIMREKGVQVWRPQLTVPMGRAADHPEWILQPWMVLDVIDTLAALQVEAITHARANDIPPSRAFHILAANNVGYFGPHEQLLRSRPGGNEAWWSGCNAGKYVLGIESDGVVKGCPSLQSSHYVQGNARTHALGALWDAPGPMQYTRTRTVNDLWGFCRTCPFASACLGGCTFTAHAILGRPGNNPYCHYRARAFAARGLRERLVPVEAAPGEPFDNGRFDVVEEPFDAPDPDAAQGTATLVKIRRARS
jgi:radical SAM protein with 4Fe4S-binding SPASM domain